MIKTRLTSLVNDVLEEGEDVWIRKSDGDIIRGTYADYAVIGEEGVELELEGGRYRVTHHSLDAEEFGLEGDEEGMVSVLHDYGFYGGKVPEKIKEGAEAAETLSGELEGLDPDCEKAEMVQ